MEIKFAKKVGKMPSDAIPAAYWPNVALVFVIRLYVLQWASLVIWLIDWAIYLLGFFSFCCTSSLD
jgi:hypothetical protein